MSWQKDGERVYWYDRAEKDGLVFSFVEIWLTRGWDESWVSKGELLDVIDRGYVPVIMHYYFGDDISVQFVRKNMSKWYTDLERLASLINIAGEVWVVLEPEFNNKPSNGTPITEWEEWNDAVIGAITRIRTGAPLAKVGICAGDFGEQDLDLCLGRASANLDFISFQEMRASTRSEPSSPGRLHVADAAIEFSDYLKSAFDKPVLLAYLGLSSYLDGDPRGWEDEQAMVIGELMDRSSELLENGVFGLIFFEYFDDPEHDGFFGEAEKHFGLIDEYDQPKLGWYVWKDKSQLAYQAQVGINTDRGSSAH